MITINIPESAKQRLKELTDKGLNAIIVSDKEYIKRFGLSSFEKAINGN